MSGLIPRAFRMVLVALGLLVVGTPAGAARVEGTLQQWHAVEVRFTGPFHAENESSPNPFLDYRLECRFEGPSGQIVRVPGFFDADGAGGTRGDVWACRLAPDEVGRWEVEASFRSGDEVAVSLDPAAGTPTGFDGEGASFDVAPSDKSGFDFRAPEHGFLTNVGDHYLAFAGSGKRWIKGGPNVPENLLGYAGFDNTPNARHRFDGHRLDWRPGDPDWDGGAGMGIIGALNYIAEQGGNSVYFLPMNIGGDARDTFPTLAPSDRTHYDTSKLRQWEIVFEHADALGIFLHFQLAETESGNENYHDQGQLGPERKLFYRELVARFGHHLGLQWDVGEENDYGTQRRRAFAAHLKALDPYDHPVTTHIHTNQMESFYGPLVGNGDFDMTAFQVNEGGFDEGDVVVEWRERSAASGVPWVVSIDEPQRIENDPTDEQRGYPHGRRTFLWPTLMSGGGGFEWYVQQDGGGHSFDQQIDDFRAMETALRWTGHALDFMDALPFWRMQPRPDLGSSDAGGKTFVLARPGDSYALYHPEGGSLSLDLRGDDGRFAFAWFDPQTGVWSDGAELDGGAVVTLGPAPFAGDVAALVVRTGDGSPNPAPVASFTVSPRTGEAPLRVLLDARSSTDDGAVVSYGWDLGDGRQASGPEIVHVYEQEGAYPVTLTVVDDLGATGTASQVVMVVPPPEPPPSPEPEPEPADYTLLVSTSNDRSDPQALADARLSGDAYVFVSPGEGIVRAEFHLDPSGPLGRPLQVERFAPHDMAGGSERVARPFSTKRIADGPHRVEVVLHLDGGDRVTIAADFEVDNGRDEPPAGFGFLVSSSPDRSNAVPLEGQPVSGPIYVFLTPEKDVARVAFYLDDPDRDGRPRQIERYRPYDFGGGSVDVARPFDTGILRAGTHRIDADVRLKDGRTISVHTTFEVEAIEMDADLFEIVVSDSANRSDPGPLDGATVSGTIHPFLAPERGVSRVRYWLDDPSRSGKPRQLERYAPYDFAGGSTTRSRPFRTGRIPNGAHRIDAEVVLQNGETVHVYVEFDVAN